MPVSLPTFTAIPLLLFIGCQTNTPAPSLNDDAYVPIQTGHYVSYDVTEQRYTLNAPPVQRTYQIKEVIGEAYADATGQRAYRLLRYRRLADGQPWQADSVWAIRRVNNELIRTENGLDFVNLVFPISDRLTWDGNRYNAAGNDTYQIRNNGQPFRVVDKQYDKTVTVVAQHDSTLTSQDKRIDVYARQVGLIYKERVQLQFCSSSPGCVGNYQIDYGIRHVYRIRTYGNE